jgi:exonuclease VII small subunit
MVGEFVTWLELNVVELEKVVTVFTNGQEYEEKCNNYIPVTY